MFDRDPGRPREGQAVALVAALVMAGAATVAHAQNAGGAPGPDAGSGIFPLLLPIALLVLMYFVMIRPQQKRAKAHQAMVTAVKRGDTVVLSNGMVGKVTRVEEAEAMVEIATGVNTRVIKSMIAEVRTRGEPAPAEKS
jgi:preprotein translocase subunit YajC